MMILCVWGVASETERTSLRCIFELQPNDLACNLKEKHQETKENQVLLTRRDFSVLCKWIVGGC